MSCIHITACQLSSSPSAFPARAFQLSKVSTCPSTYLGTKFSKVYLGTKFPKVSLKLTSATSRYQRAATVCLFGGKGKSENGNEVTEWINLLYEILCPFSRKVFLTLWQSIYVIVEHLVFVLI